MLERTRALLILIGFLFFLTSCAQSSGFQASSSSQANITSTAATSEAGGSKLIDEAKSQAESFNLKNIEIPKGMTADEVKDALIASLQAALAKLQSLDTTGWSQEMKERLNAVIQELQNRITQLQNMETEKLPPMPNVDPEAVKKACAELAKALQRNDLPSFMRNQLQKLFDSQCSSK